MTIFRQMEQCVWKKTVVPLWNQIERFFPLVTLGNKPLISARGMVRECDRGKWFSNIPVISVKMGKEDYVWSYSFFSEKFPVGRTVPFVVPPRTTGFSIQMEKALLVDELFDILQQSGLSRFTFNSSESF